MSTSRVARPGPTRGAAPPSTRYLYAEPGPNRLTLSVAGPVQKAIVVPTPRWSITTACGWSAARVRTADRSSGRSSGRSAVTTPTGPSTSVRTVARAALSGSAGGPTVLGAGSGTKSTPSRAASASTSGSGDTVSTRRTPGVVWQDRITSSAIAR